MNTLGETESLCPICLQKIPAIRVIEDGDVYLTKHCPLHGDFRVLIWRDATFYRAWDGCGSPGSPPNFLTTVEQGCPFDCGLCPDHEQDTCAVLIQVTGRCNINCPVCFAGSTDKIDYLPKLSEIDEQLNTVIESGGPYPIQISGGEPATRNDLPQVISLVRDRGFDHIQINTNGIRFAQDIDFLKQAKDSGATEIFLQFDGLDDTIYRAIRGVNLLDVKKRVIENCERQEIAVVLVPTVIPGINLHRLGEIIQFAKKRIPIVKGVHFQPITYTGRFTHSTEHQGHSLKDPCRTGYEGPQDAERTTLPDVIKALEYQTKGEVRIRDFVPPT